MVVSFRVYKKSSPNGKLTVYLGRRDFVDHVSEADPVDGVVLVDKDYLQGRQVGSIGSNADLEIRDLGAQGAGVTDLHDAEERS